MPKFKRNSKWKSRARTVSQVATKALSTALMVKKLINVEFKHIDTVPVTITPVQAGTVYAMHGCAESTSSQGRNGLSIRTKSVFVRYTITENASATATTVRVMLVKDQRPAGTTPAVTDILETGNRWIALMNNINTTRFTVLSNKLYSFSSSGTQQIHGEIYKKLNFITKYNGSTAADTDIDSNALYLIVVGSEATNTPSMTYTARVRYIDN